MQHTKFSFIICHWLLLIKVLHIISFPLFQNLENAGIIIIIYIDSVVCITPLCNKPVCKTEIKSELLYIYVIDE